LKNNFGLGLILISVLVLVSLAACTSSQASSTTTSNSNMTTSTSPGSTTVQRVTIDLAAEHFAFDKSTISVPIGAIVTVNFNNKDSGIPHNFAVYNDSSASQTIFKGQNITGPATTTYTFTAPSTPGTYFFRCDVHPTQMTGSFIVQ
jgi:plastocyanin